MLCTHHSACVTDLLEVCKYNFTEAGVAAFQNLIVGGEEGATFLSVQDNELRLRSKIINKKAGGRASCIEVGLNIYQICNTKAFNMLWSSQLVFFLSCIKLACSRDKAVEIRKEKGMSLQRKEPSTVVALISQIKYCSTILK